MLKRSPSLTEQTKSYLKERILNEEFEDGRIPSETELANELGVSRTTVRDALSRLEIEGSIFRKQGAGTFVNRPGLQIKSRLEEMWSYEAVLEAHGYTPSTQVLGIQTETAAPEVVDALNLLPGEPVVVVRKLFKEDAEPVILTLNYIPTRLMTRPYTPDNFCTPIFKFLETVCDQQLLYYLSEIVPIIADENLAATLNIPSKTALISFEETGYNNQNEPIVMASSYFRDDLLRFRLIRRQV